MSKVPEKLLPFCDVSARALSTSSRTFLSRWLNPELDSLSSVHCLVMDWRGVAEFLEFTSLDVENFALEKSPTFELLRQWAFRDTSKIGLLLEALEAVERFDILNDGQLVTLLEKDCTAYQKSLQLQEECAHQEIQPIQVDEVTSVDEFKNITVNEVNTGVPEYFDAFVCYTHQDFDFVRQMMHKLETIHGLKLCIVSRDLMPGCAEYVIMAKLIQERCRKMIIVLSPDYINSKECGFQTRFAFSLAPGAKEKKLIPVIYRPCVIPSILNHICTVDYTRCDVVEWFWTRLANSLKNPQRSENLIPRPRQFNPQSTVERSFATNTSGVGSVEIGMATNRAARFDLDDMRRTPSANSLAETGSNTSWTDLTEISSVNVLPSEVDQFPSSGATAMDSTESEAQISVKKKFRLFRFNRK